MICKKCGKEIDDDVKFCPHCGTNQKEVVSEIKETINEVKEKVEREAVSLSDFTEKKLNEIEDEVTDAFKDAEKREEDELKGKGSNYQANKDRGGSLTDSNADFVIKIISVISIVYFGYLILNTIGSIFAALFTLGYFSYFSLFNMMWYILRLFILGILNIASYLLMIVSAYALGFKRKESQTTELLVGFGLGFILKILSVFIGMLLYGFSIFKSHFVIMLIALILFAGYFIILYLSGKETLLALNYNEPKNIIMDSINALFEAILNNNNHKNNEVNKNNVNVGDLTTVSHPIANNAENQINNNLPSRPIATNRGIFKYIIFTLLTCGIYSFIFIHSLAKDVNEMCKEDNNKVGGLVAYILLSMVTCGIYPIYWQYKIANRLQENGRKYNLFFSENGTTVLLWVLIGSFLCGIGPFIAMNIIIQNTNRLAQAYNKANGYNEFK